MSMNINIGPQGYGGGMPRMPYFPGSPGNMMPEMSLQIGGHGGEGKGCCKGGKKKKDRGIIGDLLTAIFGEDSRIGRALDRRGKKKCRCRGGHGRGGRGGVNININTNQGARGFGF